MATGRRRAAKRVIGAAAMVLAAGLLLRAIGPGPAAADGGWTGAMWLSATAWAAPLLGLVGLGWPRVWLAAATLMPAALGLALYAPGFGIVGAALGLFCLWRATRPTTR